MIVWSLDNRFVLAAIMDCRICVWNASDGSLVHSLTGHTESTYVLDVHPFSPRIAMSAGYDGKTIIWDIWEGTPVRVFEIGRSKLVDGKFSSDGTSIVLSDDIGQIYLLNTGQGESHRDAKYDQFFLGDYRPLIRDSVGNVLDQESQLIPYRRNLQDPLCDSSMIPYPDPYQSMYQRRRLGALGMEWRPSSMKFAIGPDFSLGEDYHLMPLPDPEAIIDVPEPLDATLWEVENEAITDDTDSEYDIEDENSSGKEQESLGASSCSETDSDVESFEPKQKQKDCLRQSKRKSERIEVEFTASGRRIRRRRVEDCSGSSSHSTRGKKMKVGHRASKNSSRTKLSRPQRVAARNAMNVFSRIPETFSFGEDEDLLDYISSDCESLSQDSTNHVDELNWELVNGVDQGVGKPPIEEPGTIVNPVELSEAQASNGNRRKLVLKLSIRDPKKSVLPDNSTIKNDTNDSKDRGVSSPSLPCALGGRHNSLDDDGMGSCHAHVTNQRPSQSVNKVTIKCKGLPERTPDCAMLSSVVDVGSPGKITSVDGFPVEDSGGEYLKDGSNEDEFHVKDDAPVNTEDFSSRVKENAQPVPMRIKIKSSGLLKQERTRKVKIVNGLNNPAASRELLKAHTASCGGGVDVDVYNVNDSDHSPHTDYPDAETDFVRRSRSMEMKASTCDSHKVNHKLKLRKSDRVVGTSKISDSGDWNLNGNPTGGSRSTRSLHDNFYQDDHSPSDTSQSNFTGRKLSWLLLSEHEPGYRYIPQLGDEVVYLIQGHKEYVETSGSCERGPWVSLKGRINAVEICLVERLDYATAPGSGESCCKLALKFIDPSSNVCGKSFKITLPELNFPDFLVEKTWYDLAVSRNWNSGELCLVWWRNENGEGGKWWDGRIVSSKPKSGDFPDSPWERYLVQYKGDPEPQSHSPWELHDPDSKWKPLYLDFERRTKLLEFLAKLERRKQEYGLEKLERVSQRPDFLNRFPVPLSPEVVKSRLINNYYRSLEAVKHDIDVMMSNAFSYFAKNADVSKKMRRLDESFQRTLSAMF